MFTLRRLFGEGVEAHDGAAAQRYRSSAASMLNSICASFVALVLGSVGAARSNYLAVLGVSRSIRSVCHGLFDVASS